jgi:hypothetical protein
MPGFVDGELPNNGFQHVSGPLCKQGSRVHPTVVLSWSPAAASRSRHTELKRSARIFIAFKVATDKDSSLAAGNARLGLMGRISITPDLIFSDY